jgi:hypothetical protein
MSHIATFVTTAPKSPAALAELIVETLKVKYNSSTLVVKTICIAEITHICEYLCNTPVIEECIIESTFTVEWQSLHMEGSVKVHVEINSGVAWEVTITPVYAFERAETPAVPYVWA